MFKKFFKQERLFKAKAKKLIYIHTHGINKDQLNYEIENFDELGITKEKRDKKIIVSLTSYPDRMYELHYTIYSLLNQSIKPDEIVLWLAKEQFENKKVSKKVLDLQKNGLTIKWCEDLKSYKKLIPSLQEYPEDIIVTADDDIYYQRNWLEVLYEEYLKNPNVIHAHRCHKVNLKKKYAKWKHCIEDNSTSYLNLCTTGGGVLYPPKSLYKDVINSELFQELTPNADDIWFWAMAVMQGTKIKISENPHSKVTCVNPEREIGLYDESTLFFENGDLGQNDIQLKNILNHYPKLIEILQAK